MSATEPEAAATEAPAETTQAPAETAETAPVSRAPSCGGCGEQFARAAFGGRALFLAEALHDAAVIAGWIEEPAGTWTCTVCLARAAAPASGPEPEPVAEAHEPAPDTDPYDQSLAILAAFDARVPGFWAAVNRSNNAVSHKIHLRTGDGAHGIRELLGSAPALLANPELGGVLKRAEGEWEHQLAWMRFAADERSAESQVAAA